MTARNHRTLVMVKWVIGILALLVVLAFSSFIGACLDAGMLPPNPPAKYVAPCEVLFVIMLAWFGTRVLRYP